MLGGLTGIAPSKKSLFSRLVLRALVGGILSCMVRACVASLLYEEPNVEFSWNDRDLRLCTFENIRGIGQGCDVLCGDTLVNSSESCTIYE